MDNEIETFILLKYGELRVKSYLWLGNLPDDFLEAYGYSWKDSDGVGYWTPKVVNNKCNNDELMAQLIEYERRRS